ncbi:MAG: YggS family pyridoxal phosphate-dependent enzyme [Magnetovibrio sp.]|nr:YggS family pyridoxal phosphate-dependent enzyme [Magnetovibrio sp.]
MKSFSHPSDVENRLLVVQNQVALACERANRDKNGVTLVAVSKFHDAERISVTLELGHRVFGENRVQEAQDKWPDLRQAYPDINLHLIGPLQTNKVKSAVALFDVIESVDREKLARALAKEFTATQRHLPVYIQVNTGDEPQKAGILPKDADTFISLCQDELGLDVQGLMCIPPAQEEPALHFALLSKIAKRNGLKNLSMGMSGDFETAIDLGATHIRVGTAIFGQR